MDWQELQGGLIRSKYCYFYIDRGVLLCRDCSDVMKEIPDDNLRYYSAKSEKELEDVWNFEKFKRVARELCRTTKKGGVVVLIVANATIIEEDFGKGGINACARQKTKTNS